MAAVTVKELRELRAAGVKQVSFNVKGAIHAVEFFAEAPAVSPGESTAQAVPEENEIPIAYQNAFATVQRRGAPPKPSNGAKS